MRSPHSRSLPFALGLLSLVGLALGPAQARAAATVYPSGPSPYGNTNELGNQWWQWALSIPVSQSPFFDSTGANAHVNNNGPVFFLSGIFGVTEPGFPGSVGSAHRSITLPAGTPLYFPILNSENDNVGSGLPGFFPLKTEAGLRAFMADLIENHYTGLYARIDGVDVPNLDTHRDSSPTPFDVTFPNDNLYDFFYEPALSVPAGLYRASDPAFPNGTVANGFTNSFVADGLFLLVGPLSLGPHRIEFGGEIVFDDPNQNFKLDIIYDINVVPIPEPATLLLWGGLAGLAGCARWRRKRVAVRAS